MVNIYNANITSSPTPSTPVVLPVLNERVMTRRVKANKIVDFKSIPSDKGIPVKIETKATTGIVRPILAKAEPREKFRLFCKLFVRAARIAETPSGKSTITEVFFYYRLKYRVLASNC